MLTARQSPALHLDGMTPALTRGSTAPVAEFSVAVNAVTKRFANTAVVQDVSFSVRRGSFVTLLGPSGSGKTTILRMIAGFTQPSAGEILVNGRSVSALPPHKRSVGMVFQSLAIFPHMTVAENVAYPLKCRRFDRQEIPDRVSKYLKLVRLGGFERRRVDELSGGQRQRVAIARALVYQPDLLLLDEPLAALDKKLREEIQFELRRIQGELGVTTINVTHDQREALVMSDDIVVMEGGRIQQVGSPSMIYQRPSNRFVASFIGQTNVISAAFCAAMPDPAIEYALRAEKVRIGRSRFGLGEVDACLAGTVETVAYEGDRVLYEVALSSAAGAIIRIISNEGTNDLVAGDAVFMGWKTEDLVALGKGTPG